MRETGVGMGGGLEVGSVGETVAERLVRRRFGGGRVVDGSRVESVPSASPGMSALGHRSCWSSRGPDSVVSLSFMFPRESSL